MPKAWIGQSVGNINIRRKYNITIMALKQNGKMNLSITSETVLTDAVTLMVLGEYRDVQKCFHI